MYGIAFLIAPLFLPSIIKPTWDLRIFITIIPGFFDFTFSALMWISYYAPRLALSAYFLNRFFAGLVPGISHILLP